jgi:hypothetical protein
MFSFEEPKDYYSLKYATDTSLVYCKKPISSLSMSHLGFNFQFENKNKNDYKKTT